MKILYSIQATGNGHIARATELLPFFKQYAQVDVFLSGSNNSLAFDLPVKYRSKGLSLFYGNRGNLNYGKMLKAFAPLRVLREAKDLPVERYDLIINDFESITALACKLKNVPFIHFGHQASFVSTNTPRPKKRDRLGEWILQHYAASEHNIGLHFRQYNANILSPVLKQSIINAHPTDKGHITVYLSHYSDEVVMKELFKIKDLHFHLFSKKQTITKRIGNITLLPVSNEAFTLSMISASGVITGAGFETPAEVLYLGKKLLCLPILGQYEQHCNAAALEQFNVTIIKKITDRFSFQVKMWINGLPPHRLLLNHSTSDVVHTVIEKGCSLRQTINNTVPQVSSGGNNTFPLPEYSI